jgi:hypothetical protein
MLPHQTKHPCLMHGPLLDTVQVRPDAPIAPDRMRGRERPDALKQVFVAPGHPRGQLPAHPNTSSLFVNTKVNSPTRVLSRAFSRAKLASCWRSSWTSKAVAAWVSN